MLIYDTLKGKKRKFEPINKGKVLLYTCGPSVYSKPHLGNFRTYVFEDVVKRTLLFLGYNVRHVMNITDIEDKAVKAAKGDIDELRAITRLNTGIFMRNAKSLNVMPADVYPRATKSIDLIVKLIKKLLKKKIAYKDAKGDIFFDVSTFNRYGRLSGTEFSDELKLKVCKDDYFQYEAGDFLLWKAWKKSDGNIFWDTELGRGRPGWHIECSAMSMHYLAETFDIHMGGIDNVFAHHENEIAQSESATGKTLANYWLHVRHLLIEGKKMSKSLGNFYTIDDIRNMGFGFDAIRAELLSQHYRRRLNFTFKDIEATSKQLKICKSCFSSLKRNKVFWRENSKADKEAEAALAEFRKHLENDVDISNAMLTFCSFVNKVKRFVKKRKFGCNNAKKAFEVISKMDSVMGILEGF